MTRSARWMGLIAGIGMVCASARGMQAQTVGPDALENGAVALLQTWPDYAGAARMYQRAAALRAADDAQAVQDMRLAGLLFANAGDLHRAAVAMEGAGERALTIGQPGAAAEAYTNAAFIAARAGSRRAAVLAHRALWLATADGVTDTERTVIRHRIGPTVVAAVQ